MKFKKIPVWYVEWYVKDDPYVSTCLSYEEAAQWVEENSWTEKVSVTGPHYHTVEDVD